MEMQTQKTDLRMQCGKGEGETNQESNIETFTLPYVKLDSQWKFTL